MNRLARKQSADPIQEKLRANKSDWNDEVSSLIDDMIQFKKLMNGKPNKFYNEKSKIIDPIPANPNKIIDNLLSRYNSIAQKSTAITKQQIEYSKNRKKKNASYVNNSLHSEASNILSRMWSRLTNVAVGDSFEAREKRYRMGMLDTLADLYSDLKKFERTLGKGVVITTTPSKEKVRQSQQLFNKINNLWNMLLSAFLEFLGPEPQLPAGEQEPAEPTEPAKTEQSKDAPKEGESAQLAASVEENEISERNDKVLMLKEWLKKAKTEDTFPSPDDSDDPLILLRQFQLYDRYASGKTKQDKENAKKHFEKIVLLYKRILQEMIANKRLKEAENKNKKASSNNNGLPPVLAFGFLGFGGVIGPVTRDMISLSVEIRSEINSAMDSLESAMDQNQLKNLFKSIADKMAQIREKMTRVVNYFVRGSENIDAYTSLLESGDLTGDRIRLTTKERTSLKDSLRKQRLRDLSKMYSGK